MDFGKLIRTFLHKEDDPHEALARLVRAAEEDEAFRRNLLLLLRAPAAQRESMVNTALHEMVLRGEPKSARAAFAMLATPEGASAALAILGAK